MAKGHPFMRVDKETVVGMLRAIGSRDPDVLRARTKDLTRTLLLQEGAGMALVGLGGIAAFTRPGPLIGVLVVLAGWWFWRLGARNMAAVEAGYIEAVKSPSQ